MPLVLSSCFLVRLSFFTLKGLVGIVGVTCIAIRKLMIFMKKTLQDMVS